MKQDLEVWRRHARQWLQVGPPLRPHAIDVATMAREVAGWARTHGRAPRALLMGVTPELAGLAWPPGSTLLALDRSLPMVLEVWPGDTAWRGVACGDWRQPPCADGSVDLVLGDGMFNALPAAAWAAAIGAVHDLLAPTGRLLLRAFVRPARYEPVAAVIAAAEAGNIPNFHVFKWRLAMAVQADHARGVAADAVWRAWHTGVRSPDTLMAANGWHPAVVATIEAYRGVTHGFTFPSRSELRDALAGAFTLAREYIPHYTLGERCPTWVLCRT